MVLECVHVYRHFVEFTKDILIIFNVGMSFDDT